MNELQLRFQSMDEPQQQASIRRLASAGYLDQDLASMTGLGVIEVRRALRPEKVTSPRDGGQQ